MPPRLRIVFASALAMLAAGACAVFWPARPAATQRAAASPAAAAVVELRERLRCSDTGERTADAALERDTLLAQLAALAPREAIRLIRGRRADADDLRRELALVVGIWGRTELLGAADWLLRAGDPATDLADAAVALVLSHPSGTVFPLGATTVTATATDTSSNTATANFTVKVKDTTAPVIQSLSASHAILWPVK